MIVIYLLIYLEVMMKALMIRFFREEDGAAATEYAILVAAVAGIIAAAIKSFDLNGIFDSVETKVKAFVAAA